ncbi:MAG: TetR/AcrR family transcriptional regulator [Alcanivoracaceae bacterium]|jgi:AcrR family transcriptional regulator|nr:TetR/AcrR family transcriptional regulator [Alcanivoracaceae bacterium]
MTSPILTSLGDKASVTTGKGLQRAEEILMAARDILVAEGYAGLTLRGIAMRVNVSLSNVQHYYKGLDALMEALLVYLMDGYQRQIEALIKSMSDSTQRERLLAVMDLLLSEGRKTEVCGVFVEAWALGQRLPFAAQVMEQIQEREGKEFYKLMYGLNPEISAKECKHRAALSVMLIHGLMVQIPHDGTSALSRKHMEDAIRQQILHWATVP